MQMNVSQSVNFFFQMSSLNTTGWIYKAKTRVNNILPVPQYPVMRADVIINPMIVAPIISFITEFCIFGLRYSRLF